MDNPLVITGAKCTIIEGMTSLHTEQWGIISALLTIHILCMKFGMPTKRVQITHWIDNEEALRRITTTATDDLRLKSYGVRDYSDMTIMRELNEKLPKTIQIEYLKVKSHQIIGPDDETPHEVYINNVADEYANYINSTIIGPQNIYHMSTHEGILIRDDSGRAIHDTAKYIRLKIKGDEAKEYIQRKHNLNDHAFRSINWKGIESYLKSITIHKKFGIVQLMHNWQNIGTQKTTFAHSKRNKDINKNSPLSKLKDDEIEGLGKCPFQCNAQESHLHYMECKSQTVRKKLSDTIKAFKDTLNRLNTHDAVSNLLAWGINWNKDKQPPTYHSISNGIDTIIGAAIKD